MPLRNTIGTFSSYIPEAPNNSLPGYIFELVSPQPIPKPFPSNFLVNNGDGAKPVTGVLYVTVGTKTSGSVTINWGDGTTWNVSNISNPTDKDLIKYYTDGQSKHTVTVTSSTNYLKFNATVSQTNGSVFNAPYLIESNIKNWGFQKFYSPERMFWGFNKVNIQSYYEPDLSESISLAEMFKDNTEVIGNLNRWNVSSITNMKDTFNLKQLFGTGIGQNKLNVQISNWNVSNVTNIQNLFKNGSTFNDNISNWNTAKITNMSGTFGNTFSFNQSINNWNTANVTNMNGMFMGANVFNQPLNNWNTANVTNMDYMFAGASKFDQNISGWQVANVGNSHVVFDTGTPTTWTSAEKPQWIA